MTSLEETISFYMPGNSIISWSITGIASVTFIYFYYKYKFSFWAKRGIKTPPPLPIFGTSLYPLFTPKPILELHLHKTYGKLYGLYEGFLGTKPTLVCGHPEAIKQVTIKHFHSFTNRKRPMTSLSIRSRALTYMMDDEWKQLRCLLAPIFTSNKLKRMFELMKRCTNNLKSTIAKQKDQEIELKKLFAVFTVDVISTCCFSMDLKEYRHPDSEILCSARKFFEVSKFKMAVAFSLPKTLLGLMRFDINDTASIDFFARFTTEIIGKRRRLLEQMAKGQIKCNRPDDFLQILLDESKARAINNSNNNNNNINNCSSNSTSSNNNNDNCSGNNNNNSLQKCIANNQPQQPQSQINSLVQQQQQTDNNQEVVPVNRGDDTNNINGSSSDNRSVEDSRTTTTTKNGSGQVVVKQQHLLQELTTTKITESTLDSTYNSIDKTAYQTTAQQQQQQQRQKSTTTNNISNNNNNKTSDAKQEMGDLEILAQSMLFFAVGHETTATLLSTCGFFLSLNLDMQARLYEEVHQAFIDGKGDISYDKLLELEYLDAFVSEALRMYTPTLTFDREASEDVELEIEGKKLVIPKGMGVIIPFHAIHHDPDNYDEPETFDPERFLPENRHKIKPCTYIPFGSGPRYCLAMRFALIEAKLALAHLINTYEFVKTENTRWPPKFRHHYMLLQMEWPKIKFVERQVAASC